MVRFKLKGFPHLSHIPLDRMSKVSFEANKDIPTERWLTITKESFQNNYENDIICTILHAKYPLHIYKKKKKFPDSKINDRSSPGKAELWLIRLFKQCFLKSI